MRTEYEIKDKKNKSISIKKFDIEEEHRIMMDKLKSSNEYSLSRVPRPDE